MTGDTPDPTMQGYYADSIWPLECGSPRRSKTTRQPFGLRPGEHLSSTPRDTGRWNVMFVWRDPGELYLFGTTQIAAADTYGWVERVDPVTLEPIVSSPKLPCGGHTWCGAVAVHANGDLYTVNGNYVHRLSPALDVVAERRLPVDAAHNGSLFMPDGVIVTKDLRLALPASTFTLLDPERLDVIGTVSTEEPSMGRIAADHDGGGDWIYVPGDEHVFRYRYERGALTLDGGWTPRYRDGGDVEHGLAWDTTIGDGGVWLHDNGDVAAVHQIHEVFPIGSRTPVMAPNPFSRPVRLMRIDVSDAGRMKVAEVSDAGNGFVVAPPVYVPGRGIAVGFDSGGGVVTGYRYADAALTPVWRAPARNWWQPMVFADSSELVVDDFRPDAPGGPDDNIVVLDLETGSELGRTATGSPRPSGMFPCPGYRRDLYYCSNPYVARVYVA